MSSKRKLVDITNNHLTESEIPPKKSKTTSLESPPSTMGTKSPASQPKKLVIKTLVSKPKLPENFEQETWLKLQKAIGAIQSNQSVEYSLEELFQAVENLCLHKFSSNLYNNLAQQCQSHIKNLVHRLLDQTSDPSQFLTLVNNCWQEHCEHMTMIGSIFLYLDRTYVIQTPSIKSIWEMGLELFRLNVIKVPEVEKKTVSSALILIEHERKGESIDRSLMKHILMMLISLQIYSQSFETEFIQSTNNFYSAEGISYMRETEVADYLRHVENRIREEGERVLHYLDSTTRKLLIPVLERQLIHAHVDTLLERGLATLVENNRKEDLKRMYSLFARVHGLEKMKISWNTYIKTTGTSLVKDVEKEKTLVQDLMDFRSKLDVILEECFSRDEMFSTALKDAFEVFINARANKPAELIAKFVDSKLRSGNKGVTEEELEQILDKVMILFRYIHGKDVFEAFYKKDLAKRLLLGKSASDDAEKLMISKLKNECGAGFTNKLEGMFKDIEISKDTMTSFSLSPLKKSLGPIDIYVNVLTQGYWPAYTPIEINLPQELSKYLDVFKEFYLSKHNGRRLMWQNSLGYCTLIARFPHGRKELSVSLFQAVILLLFNDSEKLSYSDIEKITGLEVTELKRILQSLSFGKVRVLNKSSKVQQILDDDSFSVNNDFKQKLFRIKINSVQIAETVEEQKKTTESVMQDRQYQIDAAIVRIMKTRKQLSHPLLVSELYNQLKFPVKPSDLKKRIESLIERDYLERDETDAQLYRYLA